MPDELRVPIALYRRALAASAIFFIFLIVVLFLSAGDLGWTKGWGFLLVFFVAMVLSVPYLWRVNPEIFVARSQFHPGTKSWDFVLAGPLLLAHMAEFPVAAFDDGRFHWSNAPVWVVVVGYCLLGVGLFFLIWVQKVNRFAEPGVRIHADQKVIDTGPYAMVRHPMYAGAIPYFAGVALALGSYWALVPASIAIVLLVVRTAMEDRALREELAGYKQYAARVRYRLIPGLW
jgi:protein-S-isoprenylcysteine O-methyltransferase Ste14